MLILWQFLSELDEFLSELDDTLTQCFPVWCVYMVLTDSRSGSYDIRHDVIIFVATLGLNISETDSGMLPIGSV